MRTGWGSGSGNGGQHNYREAGRKNRTKNGLRSSYRIAKRYKTGVDYRDAGLKTERGCGTVNRKRNSALLPDSGSAAETGVDYRKRDGKPEGNARRKTEQKTEFGTTTGKWKRYGNGRRLPERGTKSRKGTRDGTERKRETGRKKERGGLTVAPSLYGSLCYLPK